MMNTTFTALVEEATFTKEILASGVTQIRNANYARKGVYFQSFTSLATGLERIGKLCLMLDYYINNNGQFPDNRFVKNEIGHNLQLLYTKSQDIVIEREFSFLFLDKLTDPLHEKILMILSDFAKGDRYSNIDFLTKQNRASDPILAWHTHIDKILFELRVSDKKKQKIKSNAEIIDHFASNFMMVRHTSESRDELNTVHNASFSTGMNEAISKYRQLYILQIIRYWVELLLKLSSHASTVNKEDIPHFSEIFAIFYNADSYLLTRKTFEKN